MRKIKGLALAILLLALVAATLFTFVSCEDEPTESITITYEKRDDGVLITGYEGVLAKETVLNIPAEIDGASVVAIADGAFRGRDDLRRIILPTSISAIGKEAFKNCENLESVNIPVAVSEIKEDTFYGCKSLSSLDIPENVSAIGEDAFKKCSGIEHLTVHGWALSYFDITGLKTLNVRGELDISFGMFSECDKLETLTIPFVGSDINATADTHFGYIFGASEPSQNSNHIPKSLTKVVITGGKIIDDYAFYGCDSIVNIMLPSELETIGMSAFLDCSSLEKATIPASTKYIGASAFENTSLKEAKIPASVTTIAESTFSGCNNLEAITIGAGVESIKAGAFLGCNSLKSLSVTSLERWLSFEFASCYDSPLFYAGNLYIGGKLAEAITIPESITKIPANAFYRCESIKTVKFSSNLTEIGDYAFAGCISLQNFTFPTSLNKIGVAAFSNCTSIEALSVGESVSEIGAYAFNLCSSLKSLTFNANITTLPEAIFRECALTDVNIGSDILAVSENAFRGTNRIKRIAAPITVFDAISKDSLTEAEITSGTEIADELFRGARSLRALTIADSVSVIGKNAFADCKNLISVNFGMDSSLTVIGEEAFKGCYSIFSFTIPGNVTEIKDKAFSGCVRLKEVYNLSSLSIDDTHASEVAGLAYSIKTSAADASSIFTYGNYAFYATDTEMQLIGYFGESSVITLPDTTLDLGKTYSIAPYAFYNEDIRVMTIPDSVVIAANTSFLGMESLAELEANTYIIEAFDADTAKNVTTLYITGGNIRSETLISFENVSTLHIGEGIAAIDATTLATKLTRLSEVIVDEGNTKYMSVDGHLYERLANGDKLVRACPMSTDYFTLPITTYEIGDYAFYGCENLNTLYIESGSVLSKIGTSAFMGAISLYSLELPATITEIGDYAFVNCLYLSDIEFSGECARYSTKGGCLIDNSTKALIRAFGEKGVCEIPEDVTTIRTGAFLSQTTITKIVLPSSIVIEPLAFNGLNALEEIAVSPDNTEYKVTDGCLIRIATGEIVLATIFAKIPTDPSVKAILAGAFSGNTKITSLVIPENITSLDIDAFTGCTSLSTITIPLRLLPITNAEFVTSLTITGSGVVTADALSPFTAIEALVIGKDITAVEEGAFVNAVALAKLEVNSENKALKAVSGTLIDIASKTAIALTPGAVIPDDGSVTRIGAYAMANKESLGSITIPGTVTEMDSTAAYESKGLTSLCAPISFLPYFNIEALTALTLTGGAEIKADDLAALVALEALTIGKTITKIEAGSFKSLKSLQSITADAENTSYKAAGGALIEVATGTVILGVGKCTLPLDGSVKAIADYAFYNNTAITELAIPTSVSAYGENALSGCTSLEKLYIASGVKDALLLATGAPAGIEIYEYSEAEPTTEGNFWYVEGGALKIWW